MAINDTSEIKKVIQIDSGNSLSILKDYKKGIDDLKSSLSSLDKSSAEYKETVQKIEMAEDQLNKMMKLNSNELTEANDKYEELIGTLSDLKSQLNEVNDAGAKLDIQNKISETTEKIIDLVDETANGKEAIDGLGNAAADAFNKGLEKSGFFKNGLGKLTKEIANCTKGLFSAGKAAMTAGMDAATAEALATAGLTLIIDAIILIISYWDKIGDMCRTVVNWVEDVVGIQDEHRRKVEETEQAIANMNSRQETFNSTLSYTIRLLQAQGKTELEVAKYTEKERAKALNQSIAEYKKILKTGTDEQIKQAGEIVKANREAYNKSVEDRKIAQVKQDTQDKKAKEAELSRQKTHNSNISKTNKTHSDAEAVQRQKEEEQRQKQAQQILDRVRKENADTSEEKIAILKDEYEKEKELLEAAGRDTTTLTENFEKKKLAILQDVAEQQQKLRDKEYKAQVDQLKTQEEQELYELQFKEYEGSNAEQEKQELDAKWEIESEYYDKRIEQLELYLETFTGSTEEQKNQEKELDDLRREYSNKKMKYEKESSDKTKKLAKEEKDYKEKQLKSALSTTSSIFGTLSDLAGENSEEQKLFAIMQTTIDTLSGAIAAYKSMCEIGPAGPALGAAAAAAVTAAGIANINKIKSTTKDSSSTTPTAPEAPSLSMTSVSPLLNEDLDTQRMTTLSEQGDSTQNNQNLRVYVVDQDIRDANNKAEVVQNNATF